MVASGGGFEKSVSNQSSQVWKVLKDHENLGIDEKKFPKIVAMLISMKGVWVQWLSQTVGRLVKARASTTLTQGWR